MSLRRSLLPVLLFALTLPLAGLQAQSSNGITREIFTGISAGGSIPGLTNNVNYPNFPAFEEVLTTYMDYPQTAPNIENFGTRLRALVRAPTTGNYIFWISGDDNCELWLSTDASPANRRRIASVNTWTSWREWTKETNQQSTNITLVAGQQYYIEALQSEGGGGDSISVRWQLPGGVWENPGDPTLPIPAARCTPVGVTAPVFLLQPTNVTVVEGNSVLFGVTITHSFSAAIQWQRNGTNVPLANATNYLLGPLTLSDSGSVFRCSAQNFAGTTLTTNALLRVIPDTTPPTLSSVGNLGDNDVLTVVFSEPVEIATAANAANYAINNGVAVLSATFGVDNQTIVLTTTPMAPNVTYTLTVNNVRDRANTPNTIALNTQRTFNINSRPLAIGYLKPSPEPIGPATRRGPFVISEVMYHPTNRFDGRNIEFIEVYNSNPWFEEMGGFKISGAVEFTFPTNFVLQAQSYAVVAAVPSDLQAVYGLTGVLGPWTGSLQNGDGTLRLRNARGAVMFEMEYAGDPPWPVAADGGGHSLVLARPSYGAGDPRAWAPSDVIGGTPRTNEVLGANSYRTVTINEFLAHTDLPDLDYIELHNCSSSPVNLTGCVLTDDPDTNKFVIPASTIIPANGFVVYYETNLGFSLSSGGETVFFKNPQSTRVIDAVRFEGQENGVATGRYPDGAPDFSRLAAKTPGTNNTRPRPPVVVINEIMFDPLSDNSDDEFVELYNPGTNAVNVSKWRLKDAVKFTIPNNTLVPAQGFLVLAGNALRLRANYPGQLNTANCLGDWDGSLKNSGERLALTMPDETISTNGLGQPVTNTIHILMDEVLYRDGGRWGRWADGGGSSLELRDARADRRLAANWGDSDESTKNPWVNVEATGVMDNGYENATQLHITLLGAGEALIDNVEVFASNWGTNLIGNGTFETGTNGWTVQGNHNATSLETTAAFAGTRSLHLRATGRGDTGANRVRTSLPFTLASGTANVTLRAKVKWLKGSPNILLRLRGNYMEAPGYTVTARNLGTPGLPNTVATTNAPPSISDVAHWPALPAASQQVLVTARASDPDGLATMLLSYRLDPSTNFTTVSMTNNGAGWYSAVLPGQAAGAVAAFFVQAADKLSPQLGSRFPNDAPVRECLVSWGDTTAYGNNSMGLYRFWISQNNITAWSAEEKMSNKPKDVTFIYGTNRVVYNAGAWFHGSPYHSPAYDSPVGAGCDYDMNFPKDDKFLGETDINLFRPGNGGGDGTVQGEIHAYWFGGQFGVPFLYHRPVFLRVNSQLRGVFHDAQQPNGDFVDQWFPDDANGDLHKIQLGFEFGETAVGANEAGYTAVGANFARYTTTGGAFKMARYRQTLPRRSSSALELNDYTNIFTLVNNTLTTAALNSAPYTTVLTNTFDVREWFKVHVTQHLYNNYDSFSYGGGQNAFMYKPERAPWSLFLWDVDFAFGGSATDANLLGIGGADHGPRNDHAPFTRIYWQALIEAANSFMSAARSNPILDARYAGMTAAGAGVASPQGIKDFIAARRSYILGVIAATNTSPFDIQSNGGVDFATSNNLVTLTGRAPLDIARLEVNGTDYPVTWTSVTTWSIRLALPPGTNALTVIGYDLYGNPVSGANDFINVSVVAPLAPPQENLVINEIMFDPLVPGAEYVELFNTSTNASFDVSGWRLDGVGYVFPEGVVLAPRTFFLLVSDPAAFALAYGTNTIPSAVYPGNLQASGETLTFVKPGLTPATDLIIDKVRYDNSPPWTTNANATGSSVQLIDSKQDNARPGNWFSLFRSNIYSPEISTPARTNDGWQFVSATGAAGPGAGGNQMRLVINLGNGEINGASALLDDIAIVAGTNAGVGYNFVHNGDFESSPLIEVTNILGTNVLVTNSWYIGTNYTNTLITSGLAHAGSGALKLVCQTFGNAHPRIISQLLSPAPLTNAVHTLSFWYWATNSATNLTVKLLNSGPLNLTTNINITFIPSNYVPPVLLVAGTNTLSPGTNNTGAATLVPFPNLWLNEVMADNLSGLTDQTGTREPWIEIFNAGSNTVTLTNLYLSDNYTNLLQWAFPTNSTLGPTQFMVLFADGEPGQTTNTELHTSFRLPPGAGSLALTRVLNGATQVLDYVNYTAGLDHSYGSVPDGQLFTRQEFYFVTPGATNDGTLPPVLVFINEWMADNLGALADPADNDFEDWFEIYNPGSNAVSLAGYYLTDTLTNKFKYQIPPGYSVPPHGYLLVWADSETGQNSPARPDLHANFSLAKSGEAIGLFTPTGIAIDSITFGAQTTDIAAGRFPDGSASVFFLTNYTPRAANFYPLPNVAPVLNAIANQNVFENELVFFTAVASDANPGQQLNWSLLPGAPAGASIGATNGLFNWLPGELDGGNSYPVSIRVSDSGTPPLSSTQSFTITVQKTNSAPVITPSGDKTISEGAPLTFTVNAVDHDIPAQTVTYSLDPKNLPAGPVIDPATGAFSWTPTEEQGPGVYSIRVRATDDAVPPLSESYVLVVTVTEANVPPVLDAITNRTAALGEAVTFTATGSDTDQPAQHLSFDFAGPPPAGATINATNGAFHWIANTSGTNTFTLRVTDDGPGFLSATQSFQVVVAPSELLTSIGISNQVVSLGWNSIVGRSYSVEFRNTLNDGGWTPLATNLLATNSSLVLADAVGTNTQRIYRVVLEP